MLCAICVFLEFCYTAQHEIITERTLINLEDVLSRFHEYWVVFQEEGIWQKGFSLLRQHSTNHYPAMIHLFGAPNGLCLSITEAKHIKAVKEPWHQSNHNKPLKQILLTNQCLDKLAAAQIDFMQRGMLKQSELNDSLKLIGLSSIFSCVRVPLTNVAEQMQREYNDLEELKATVNDGGPLGIVDYPSVLARTKLNKTLCKWCKRTVLWCC